MKIKTGVGRRLYRFQERPWSQDKGGMRHKSSWGKSCERQVLLYPSAYGRRKVAIWIMLCLLNQKQNLKQIQGCSSKSQGCHRSCTEDSFSKQQARCMKLMKLLFSKCFQLRKEITLLCIHADWMRLLLFTAANVFVAVKCYCYAFAVLN